MKELIFIVTDIDTQSKSIWIYLGHRDNLPKLKDIASAFQGYRIVVFRSGYGDVRALTGALLTNNC